MRKYRKLLGVALTVALAGVSAASAPLEGKEPLAAVQGTRLFGGPGAKGTGAGGARFDTTIYVSAVSPASGSVDYFAGGRLVVSQTFAIPSYGVAVLATPAALDGLGAFLFRVVSDADVNVWSETYNDASSGRFSVSTSAFATSDFLNPGDEASGGGADASSSTSAGRARTNVGVLCSPDSSQGCNVEVAAFDGGALLGTGSLLADPGSAGQSSLASLIPAAAERSGLGLRLRILAGSANPYVIKNDNRTSDGSFVPLSVVRGAFSTAPLITSFTVTPTNGCAPQVVTLTWSTTGAVRVIITGVAGDLPPNGTAAATVQSTTDLVLTAFSASGASSSLPRRVTLSAPPAPPTPAPDNATVAIGGQFTGIIPLPGGQIAIRFRRQESTGSTFSVTDNAYIYVAGTTTGTDIVELTVTNACGSGTALFTANVIAPGSPTFLRFEASPMVGCRPANIVLSWETRDAQYVILEGVDLTQPPNGSYGFTIDATTTFKITAYGVNGQKTSKTLTVPVDVSLQYPVLNPSSQLVDPGQVVDIVVTGVADTRRLAYYVVQLPSGGSFQPLSNTLYRYTAGVVPGAVDIIRITYTNGCGNTFSEFRATVNNQP